ncbi:MAG TPA: sigma-70 family RNA polymerase sigma factor [Cytophagales bacterium]|nr:sigma-70 family RNA polymerase sigma factor [Cytophagales bacterium]
MKIAEHDIPSLIKQGKDSEVITSLYKIVFPKVKKYIGRHNGVQDDAYDVFQDAILYFYKQVVQDQFNVKYSVYGYLFKLSIHRWLNILKKSKRMDLTDDIESEDFLFFEAFDFKEVSFIREDENLLEKLFSNIGSKCIEILTYTIYNNLMLEDIALRMGIASEGAVKMQLKRCRKKLIEEVERNPAILDQIIVKR